MEALPGDGAQSTPTNLGLENLSSILKASYDVLQGDNANGNNHRVSALAVSTDSQVSSVQPDGSQSQSISSSQGESGSDGPEKFQFMVTIPYCGGMIQINDPCNNNANPAQVPVIDPRRELVVNQSDQNQIFQWPPQHFCAGNLAGQYPGVNQAIRNNGPNPFPLPINGSNINISNLQFENPGTFSEYYIRRASDEQYRPYVIIGNGDAHHHHQQNVNEQPRSRCIQPNDQCRPRTNGEIVARLDNQASNSNYGPTINNYGYGPCQSAPAQVSHPPHPSCRVPNKRLANYQPPHPQYCIQNSFQAQQVPVIVSPPCNNTSHAAPFQASNGTNNRPSTTTWVPPRAEPVLGQVPEQHNGVVEGDPQPLEQSVEPINPAEKRTALTVSLPGGAPLFTVPYLGAVNMASIMEGDSPPRKKRAPVRTVVYRPESYKLRKLGMLGKQDTVTQLPESKRGKSRPKKQRDSSKPANGSTNYSQNMVEKTRTRVEPRLPSVRRIKPDETPSFSQAVSVVIKKKCKICKKPKKTNKAPKQAKSRVAPKPASVSEDEQRPSQSSTVTRDSNPVLAVESPGSVEIIYEATPQDMPTSSGESVISGNQVEVGPQDLSVNSVNEVIPQGHPPLNLNMPDIFQLEFNGAANSRPGENGESRANELSLSTNWGQQEAENAQEISEDRMEPDSSNNLSTPPNEASASKEWPLPLRYSPVSSAESVSSFDIDGFQAELLTIANSTTKYVEKSPDDSTQQAPPVRAFEVITHVDNHSPDNIQNNSDKENESSSRDIHARPPDHIQLHVESSNKTMCENEKVPRQDTSAKENDFDGWHIRANEASTNQITSSFAFNPVHQNDDSATPNDTNQTEEAMVSQVKDFSLYNDRVVSCSTGSTGQRNVIVTEKAYDLSPSSSFQQMKITFNSIPVPMGNLFNRGPFDVQIQPLEDDDDLNRCSDIGISLPPAHSQKIKDVSDFLEINVPSCTSGNGPYAHLHQIFNVTSVPPSPYHSPFDSNPEGDPWQLQIQEFHDERITSENRGETSVVNDTTIVQNNYTSSNYATDRFGSDCVGVVHERKLVHERRSSIAKISKTFSPDHHHSEAKLDESYLQPIGRVRKIDGLGNQTVQRTAHRITLPHSRPVPVSTPGTDTGPRKRGRPRINKGQNANTPSRLGKMLKKFADAVGRSYKVACPRLREELHKDVHRVYKLGPTSPESSTDSTTKPRASALSKVKEVCLAVPGPPERRLRINRKKSTVTINQCTMDNKIEQTTIQNERNEEDSLLTIGEASTPEETIILTPNIGNCEMHPPQQTVSTDDSAEVNSTSLPTDNDDDDILSIYADTDDIL